MRFLATFLPWVLAPAWGVTLNFSALPSTQGWNFVSSGVTELSNVSLSAGVLSLNTMGVGTGFGWYEYSPPLNTGTSYLVFEARLLNNEGTGYEEFGFGFGVYDNGTAYVVGLGQGYVKAYQGTTANIDTSLFHTYVLAVNHDLQSYVLSADGNQLLVGSPVASTGNAILFGDLTTGGNANGDLRYLSYGATPTLPDNGVPEPSPALLVATGLLLVAIGAHRRQRELRQ